MMNGKVIHEEAVAWDPPGEPIQFDVCKQVKHSAYFLVLGQA
jgi:hypothetical protein